MRAAAIVSREYEIALTELADLSAHAATGRQFSSYLRDTETGAEIAAAIDQLVAAIDKTPAGHESVARLIVLLDAVGRSLSEGGTSSP